MDKYFISLDPDKNISDKIIEQKNTIFELVGEQKYLSHPPHTTAIVFTSDNIDKVIQELAKLSSQISRFEVEIKGLHIFYNDAFTEGNSITYSFDEKSTEKLKKIQMLIIDKINKYNTKKFIEQDSPIYAALGNKEKENAVKYGFPFVGNVWFPHITLASINKEDFEEVYDKINSSPIKSKLSIPSISLYKVGEHSLLIKKFDLSKNG